jgi:hypothetical protein
MTGSKIVDLALSTIDNLDAALRIGAKDEEIRKRVHVSILTNVQRRLEQWIQQKAGDWEITDKWQDRTWINNHSEKWLLILLRRKGWPNMFGAALCPDDKGPSQVFVGISAPTQRTWDNDAGSVRWYGMRTGFVDDNTRQAIVAALGLESPEANHWIITEWLQDIDGQDISDWRNIETIKLLHAKSDEMARQIVGKMTKYVEDLDATGQLSDWPRLAPESGIATRPPP